MADKPIGRLRPSRIRGSTFLHNDGTVLPLLSADETDSENYAGASLNARRAVRLVYQETFV